MSFPRIYLHLVWTTRNRDPLITAELAQFLVRYLTAIAGEDGANLIAGGIVSTHIHLLIRVPLDYDIPKLVQRFKGGSARIATRDGIGTLRWAKGYSVSSVGPKAIPALIAYLRSQPTHHPMEKIPGFEKGFFSSIPEGTAYAVASATPVAEPSLQRRSTR